MISDPGTMSLMPKDPWIGVTIPTFVSTGSNDYSEVSSVRVNSPFKYESSKRIDQVLSATSLCIH